METIRDELWRFVEDEGAQDLMEYAFLGAFIGVVAVLMWQSIVSLLSTRYSEYNSQVQAIWASPDP